MKSYQLKIPATRRTTPHHTALMVFVLINSELRRKPGTSDEEWQDDIIGLTEDYVSGVKRLTVGQNHGIRETFVSARLKEAFKREMPYIIEMFPGMASPFQGHIEFYEADRGLREVHFLPKN